KAGNVLPLGGEIVGETWPIPVDSAVVREIETLFGAGHHFTAVIRIHANLANSVILWELPGRLVIRHAEHVGTKHRPGSSGISGLEDTLATHGKGTEIEVARTSINSVMIVR